MCLCKILGCPKNASPTYFHVAHHQDIRHLLVSALSVWCPALGLDVIPRPTYTLRKSLRRMHCGPKTLDWGQNDIVWREKRKKTQPQWPCQYIFTHHLQDYLFDLLNRIFWMIFLISPTYPENASFRVWPLENFLKYFPEYFVLSQAFKYHLKYRYKLKAYFLD